MQVQQLVTLSAAHKDQVDDTHSNHSHDSQGFTTSSDSDASPVTRSDESCHADCCVSPTISASRHKFFSNPQKYKTTFCSFLLAGQPCPYDPFCAFAHNPSELRHPEQNIQEGIQRVNTVPRSLIYQAQWIQEVKYVRKTGPSCGVMPTAVAKPSFLKPKNYTHNPYAL